MTPIPRRIREKRSFAACWSTRSTRRPRTCSTTGRRCEAHSSAARMPVSPPPPARRSSPSSKWTSSACWPHSVACSNVRAVARRWSCRRIRISIEDRIRQLLARLSETEACGFEEMFLDGDGSRGFLIVTFLALLEMIRLKLIRVSQAGSFGAIRVYKRARPADAPHPIGDPQSP